MFRAPRGKLTSMKKRSDQINALIKKHVAELLRKHLREDKFGMLTVTHVEAARGLDSCKVFISCMKNGHQMEEEVGKVIMKIQADLNKLLVMRRVPKLIIVRDNTSALTEKLDSLLN